MYKEKHEYPLVLNVNHIMEILNVSSRVAYEIMKQKGFPVLNITGAKGMKRVPRDMFFEWLYESAKGD